MKRRKERRGSSVAHREVSENDFESVELTRVGGHETQINHHS